MMLNGSLEYLNESQLKTLDANLVSIDKDMAISLSMVRRAQGLSIQELGNKFSGIKESTLRRYMQQSYTSIRPLHIVAALSWVMMVPMTSFYYALKAKEHYRGMDTHTINALFCIGRLPTKQFDLYIDMLCELMNAEDRVKFQIFREELLSTTPLPLCYESLLPPEKLDLNAFAIDYYRSCAINIKRFRLKYNIPIEVISRTLGLSLYQYEVLEDVNKVRDFSVSIGFRVKLGFQLHSHVNFTSDMVQFAEFHELRKFQHFRDELVTKALGFVSDSAKEYAVNILTNLSLIYLKN